MAGLRRTGLLVSIGYMDPGNWGTDLSGGCAVQIRPALGGRPRQSDGHLPAGHLRAAGSRHRQGPGPMLPRLVSRMDALAQLAVMRTGHRGVRPGRSARQCRRDQPAQPHPHLLGGSHHRHGRAAAAGPAAIRHAEIEAVVLVLVSTIALCYFIEIFVIPQTKPSFLEMGHAAVCPVSGRRGCCTWRSGLLARP